ncbi:MAG TPA: amino acid adenylation domain-containing protein, partial [Pyrinomonadaceae bacterium]
AMLGVLKAGAAYVPLDPTYPAQRLAFMLADTQARVVVSQSKWTEKLPVSSASIIRLDTEATLIARESAENLRVEVSAENLANVIYTSGSTGTPKGVCVLHRGVVRLVKENETVDAFTDDEVLMQAAPLAFDASTLEIWGSLLNGGRLVVMASELASLEEIGRTIRERRVTTLWLTAGLFHLMMDERPEDLCGLRQMFAGGDVLSVAHVRRFLQASPSTNFVNGYGPTENTIFTTIERMRGEAKLESTVPIGRPVSNTTVYILDEHLRPVPCGVVGELYTGGDGLARGYLKRPELTAERFIPNPFGEAGGERLYRTGDLARYLEDGRIEFLGRRDEQVKVRGFRIELGEIEAALKKHEEVREASVVAREDAPGERRLVAYVVARDASEPDVKELREFLRVRLPDYMIPSAFVLLDALPLTPNGKIDKRALPAPEEFDAATEGSFLAPRTEVEELLSRLWEEVLSVERVGVRDDFFTLGGHSLLATRLVSRIRESFGVELPLRSLFESPTVGELAVEVEASLRSSLGEQSPPIRRVSREGKLPLSFAQQRLWFLHKLEPASPFYNMPVAVRLSGRLDMGALERTLNEIVRRHESLRTSLPTVDGQPIQLIAPPRPLRLPVVDISALPSQEREREAHRRAAEEARTPFDLSKGTLFRAWLLRLGDEEHVLLVTMHHVISDGWSMGVLIREVATLYRAYVEGEEESPLAELPVQYADFAVWQRRWLAGEVFEAHLSYWKRQLGGELPVLNLPTDRPRPQVQSFRGASYTMRLPASLAEALRALCRREGATLYMLLLAAFKTLLHRYTNQTDILVGSPIANRNRIELEGLIGFFVNTLVLRTDVSDNPGFRHLLSRVREVTLEAYAHQDMPFEKVVE